MNGFNLSEWSIRNRSVVIYLMIIVIVAGGLTFLRLGRAEDPVFTIRTMSSRRSGTVRRSKKRYCR